MPDSIWIIAAQLNGGMHWEPFDDLYYDTEAEARDKLDHYVLKYQKMNFTLVRFRKVEP